MKEVIGVWLNINKLLLEFIYLQLICLIRLWRNMHKKCKSRIIKEFKKAKATSIWPETIYGPVPENLEYPECGGDLTFGVHIYGGCCCGMSDGSNLNID